MLRELDFKTWLATLSADSPVFFVFVLGNGDREIAGGVADALPGFLAKLQGVPRDREGPGLEPAPLNRELVRALQNWSKPNRTGWCAGAIIAGQLVGGRTLTTFAPAEADLLSCARRTRAWIEEIDKTEGPPGVSVLVLTQLPPGGLRDDVSALLAQGVQ